MRFKHLPGGGILFVICASAMERAALFHHGRIASSRGKKRQFA
jgi:hypothetical protein